MQPRVAHPPTAFLVVHGGFAARYLLRTDILPTLVDGGIHVVVLAPNHDEDYFREEMAAAGAVVEPLRDAPRPDPPMRFPFGTLQVIAGRFKSLIGRLRRFALSGEDSPAFIDRYRGSAERYSDRRWRWTSRMVDVLIRRLMWRSSRARRFVLALDMRLNPAEAHGDLFERYRPDLVVTTGPGYARPDQLLLNEARRRGVPTAAAILGWDNPTSKGYRGADPDVVVAWSERMADQLVRFQDVPRRRIHVGGVPHFDSYHRSGALLSWEELCESEGLDRDRPMVVFATSTPGAYAHNTLVAEALAAAVGGGRLSDVQLVVRLHPVFLRGGAFADIRAYEELLAPYRHVHLNVPEVVSQRMRLDMSRRDTLLLGSLIHHARVLVNVFSTTTLEAFIADTPVVMVAPDLHLQPGESGEVERRRVWQEFTHLRPLVASGAAPVAHSPDELVEHARAYLDDPALDRDRRLAVARAETGPADGQAGERIARILLDAMGEGAAPAPAVAEPAAARA